MNLDIIIVNWNAGDHLRKCLETISKSDKTTYELNNVVIVDNASSDGSADDLDDIDLPIRVIRNLYNKGFAAACNQGAESCQSDYLLFLNPDTELHNNSLANSIEFMEKPENDHVGICGIHLVDESGNAAISYARFPRFSIFLAQALGLDKAIPSLRSRQNCSDRLQLAAHDVDQVIGAFFLVRLSLYKQLAGFDERFFVYFEEVDFSLRAKLAGWRSVCLADVKALHVGGVTTSQVKAARLFYSLRSRLLYAFKHFSPVCAWGVFIVTLFLDPVSRVVFSLIHGSFRDALHSIEGYLLLIRDLGTILHTAHSDHRS